MHIALLGDSVFDNHSYVGPKGLSVIEHLQRECKDATLLARDGAVTTHIDGQIDKLTSDVTHVVVSVGGNDALRSTGMLTRKIPNIASAFFSLHPAQKTFSSSYRHMCRRLDDSGRAVLLCAIYNPCNPPEQKILQQVEVTALSLFNDVIYRTANEFGFPVLDLRQVCTKREHYANPIEPSHLGGGKIVDAILDRMTPDYFLHNREDARSE
jgi:hypothetical protein